ncbi:heparan-alpha-glucosaminide N-acetyltransferase domain-containing protein, partial [Micrococcus luteus]|uniref:heparan-alpha-glucosaminide N-acetyltransferase domain-containing protein n=1 Tax=Micrococcus luteus TaxID=1270 RepID=UPI002011D820
APPPAAVRPDRPARRRLPGVDAARGIALLGMVTVHVVDPVTADGAPHPAFLWFAGRASVLFVLLAGVGLALSTGGATPATGIRRAALRRLIARARVCCSCSGSRAGRSGSPWP